MNINRLCVFAVLLVLQIFNIPASDKKDEWQPLTHTYEFSSRNPTAIIKTDLKTGQQEIIPVLPGQNPEEQTAELMMIEVIAWMNAKNGSSSEK